MFRSLLRHLKGEASFTAVERGILFCLTLIFVEQMAMKI
jgi:hypothetical protein